MTRREHRRITRHLVLAGLLALAPLSVSAADRPPADSQWRLATLPGVGTIDPSQTRLRVDAQGNLSGKAGCNTFRQDFSESGYGEIALTRKTCPEANMRQEEAFVEALRRVEDWQVEDRRLTLRDAQGERLAVLIEPATRRYHFVCGEETIRFEALDRETIRLTHAGGTLDLSRVRAASGARYESEDGQVVFWGKGTTGRFEVDGSARDCEQIPAPD